MAGLTFPEVETHIFPGLVSQAPSAKQPRSILQSRRGEDCVDGHRVFACLSDDTVQRKRLHTASGGVESLVIQLFTSVRMSTAMFLYALAVLLWVDRNPSGSAALVFAATLVLFGHNDAGMAPAAGSFAWLRRELPAAKNAI